MPIQIMFRDAAGTRPIRLTRWASLAETIETVALGGWQAGHGPKGAEDAVYEWSQGGGADRPAIDEVLMEDANQITLSEFDATAAAELDPDTLAWPD